MDGEMVGKPANKILICVGNLETGKNSIIK